MTSKSQAAASELPNFSIQGHAGLETTAAPERLSVGATAEASAAPPRMTGGGGASRIRVALQPLQVGPHLRGMLIAQVAVFLQSLIDDPFQFGRHSGIQPQRRSRRRIQDGFEDLRGTVAA